MDRVILARYNCVVLNYGSLTLASEARIGAAEERIFRHEKLFEPIVVAIRT